VGKKEKAGGSKMTKSYGWAGTILKVDLTNGKIEKASTSEYQPEKFIGGVGLSCKIYWDMGCPGTGPFDPNNPVLVSVGPMTGLPGPFNRGQICGIGAMNYPKPQFSYSGFGGMFPAAMKYAGYDVIVVTGKSKTPVYLDIQDEEVIIRDARHIWGTDIVECQKTITEKNPKGSVMAIGPAGENLSASAVVANETGNTAGQGGFGAVMGSKNLKAISVKGSGSINIADAEAFRNVVETCDNKETWSEGAAQAWARSPLCGGDVQKEMVAKYRKKFGGSYGCPYQCMGFYKVPGIGSGGAMCASWWYGFWKPDKESLKTTWKANVLAQNLGINHFDLLAIVKIIGETLEEGLMTIKDWEEKAGLGSLPDWIGGSVPEDEFLESLVTDIALGKSIFSQGVNKAMHQIAGKVNNGEAVKKIVDLEFPAWGYPQHYYGWLGLCLHVALDTRDSGNSTDGYLAFNRDSVYDIPQKVLGDHFGVPYGTSTFAHAEGSGEKAVWEDIEIQTKFETAQQSLRNSITMCNFASLPDAYFHPEIGMDVRVFQSRVFSATTGVKLDIDALWIAGERIWNLRRAINIKVEGRSRDMDTYVDNFFDVEWFDEQDSGGTMGSDGASEEELGEGSKSHMRVYTAYIDRKKFEALKDRYYRLAGWDVMTGWPTRTKLEELDLKDVADQLETMTVTK
jgi:aldehyde:ferredoxin oxidoreductase